VAAYYVVCEALANATKYNGATTVEVDVTVRNRNQGQLNELSHGYRLASPEAFRLAGNEAGRSPGSASQPSPPS
jgi:hypothetical protein